MIGDPLVMELPQEMATNSFLFAVMTVTGGSGTKAQRSVIASL
jgi:hypothetical protein